MMRNRSDSEMYNLRSYVDEKFWRRLVAKTSAWPMSKRNQAAICRYAMTELENDLREAPEDVVTALFPAGTQSVQTCTLDVEEARMWSQLAKKYGTGEMALRVALANLLQAIDT